MTCTEFLAKLDELIEGSVSAEMRKQLEEHLGGCAHCTVTLNTTRKTIEIYRKHEIYELPDAVRVRLEEAILAKCKKC